MSLPLPPCTANCPVQTDVRGYLAALARGNYQEAERLIRANNPFASVCAWICHHPCEDSCRRKQVDASLSLRALKRFVLEKALPGKLSTSRTPNEQPVSYRVAVVGAGPAGLTAAYDLARFGYAVTVFERQQEPGGHFYSSLPTYRLPRQVLRQDIARIIAAGVDIRTGVEIGRDLSLSSIQEEYDAVILALGLSASRGLSLPEFEHPDVLQALPFLQGVNLGHPAPVKKRVIVIGGGNVAIDVARTALRLGAQEVRVVYRKFRNNMKAHQWEIAEALEEGIELWTGWSPVRVIVEKGQISGLEVQGVKPLVPDRDCINPTDETSTSVVPGEMIIQAIGQFADMSFLSGHEVSVDERGQLIVNRDTLATNVPGVFACGEVATGAGPAIAAIASGHRVAAAVRAYLEGTPVSLDRVEVIGDLPSPVLSRLPSLPRQKVPVLSAEVRCSSFVVQELGFSEPQALREAERCLRCGLGAEVIQDRCAACLTCLRVCPYGVPVIEERARIPVEACQGCGICAAACPAGAILIKGLPREEVSAALQGEKVPAVPAVFDTDPPLALFVCQRAYFQGLPPDFISSTPGLGRARVISLPTAGALDPVWVLNALEEGAVGVAVITCGKNNCRHSGGAARVRGQLERLRMLIKELGFSPECLQWHCLGEGGDPLGWLSDFARRLVQGNKF